MHLFIDLVYNADTIFYGKIVLRQICIGLQGTNLNGGRCKYFIAITLHNQHLLNYKLKESFSFYVCGDIDMHRWVTN